MPLYVIERAFAEELELTGDDVRQIDEINADEGVRWLFSFLSADKRHTYCLYEAPIPEAIRAAAERANVPADAIVEVSGLASPELAPRMREWAAPPPAAERRRLRRARRAAPPRAPRPLLPHAGLGPRRRRRAPGDAARRVEGASRVRGTQLAALLAVHDRDPRLAAHPRGRKRRALPGDIGGGDDPRAPLGAPLAESVWIEPYPDELLRYEDREGVELAYVAALQLLPPNQRAALLLCEVLGFSARETAEMLETSVASVNSALQRGRAKLERERPARSQQETLRALGDERSRELVVRFVDAWSRADVEAIVAMLTEDASFTMPPLPTWFRGRADIARLPHRARLPHALAVRGDERRRAARDARPPARRERRVRAPVLTVFTFEGERVAALTAFLGDGVLDRFCADR